MSKKIDKPQSTVWYIVNNGTYYRYGYLEPGNVLETGLPTLERFDSKDLWLARLTFLGLEAPTD